MKSKKIIVLFVMVVGFITNAMAQDKIYMRKQKGFVKAKITEIGLEEIKYKEFDNPDGPQFTVEKDDIEKIVYATGRTETFEQSIAAKVSLKEMHKNNIKMSFFAPLTGHLSLSYERAIKRGQAWEVHASGVGLGIKQPHYYYGYDNTTGTSKQIVYYKKQKGLMLGGSYKLIFTPDMVMRGMRSRHIMQGSYIRPSVYMGAFNYQKIANDNPVTFKTKSVTTAAVILNFGKEWIISNRASLDVFAGIGYGFDNHKYVPQDNFNVDDFASFYYFYSRLTSNQYSNSFLAVSGGIKLGYLYHTKKEKENELDSHNK